MRRSGWTTVVAAWFCLFVGASPVYVFTFGNFMRSLTAEYGWSRGMMSTAFAITGLAGAIMAPVLGRLIDRYGLRRVTLPFLIAAALAVAAQALNDGSVALFVLILFAPGILCVVLTGLPYSKGIVSWFDRDRGMALGIATLGGSIGLAVVPQMTQYVISQYGWRAAYVFLGVLILLLGFGSASLLLDERTCGARGASNAGPLEIEGMTAGEGLRSWRIWVLCAAFLLAAAGASGVVGQIVPLLTDRGVPVSTATGALAVFAVSGAVARLGGGFILDRVFAPLVGAAVFAAAGVGVLLILTASGSTGLVIGVLLCGVAVGVEYDLLPFLVARYVGTRAYGELVGYAFMCFTLGTGVIGPYVMGNSYSLLGSYSPALILFTGFLFAAAAALLTIGPYSFVPSLGRADERLDGASPTKAV